MRATIERHIELYHTYDTPEISDEAYDALMRELEEIEEHNFIVPSRLEEEKERGE